MFRHLLFLLLFLGLEVSLAFGNEGLEFFERKIRPVLVEQCYSCHSADKKQRGGLVLDTREGLFKGGDTGPALVPGKPEDSLLIKALRYTDPGLRMPPKGKLPAEVVADFEQWVRMGAPDPRTGKVKVAHKYPSVEEGRKFWAFQPIRKPAVPTVKDAAWPWNDIDRFILGRLEEKKLRPNPDADRAVLLRRLYYALLGLPPTPEETDAFLQSASRHPQAAIMEVVDRLLASPHFGERWGRHWLDVARFAESTGGGRTMLLKDAWRYRDYVIRSFNNDLPLSQFIREQLAGDLLEAKTPEERYWRLVATAFLLLGPTNYERQDKPLLEMDIIDEQLDTIGKGFLGMTLGCARCHDHKFDPIPTKDYYALAGIFKSTKFIVHSNVSKWMERPLPLPQEQELAFRQTEEKIASLKKQIQQLKAKTPNSSVVAEPLKGTPISPKDLPGIVVDDSQAKKVGNWKHSTFTGRYIGIGYLYDDRAMKGVKTLTFQPEFTKAGIYEVRLAYIPHTNRADKVEVRIFHVDGDDTVYVNQKQMPPIEGRFISLGRYRFEPGSQWFVMVTTEKANGHVVADAVQFLPEEALPARTPPGSPARTPPGSPETKTLAQLETELKKLETQLAQRPMVMAVAEGDKIDDFYVCVRGNVHNQGERVARGFLQVATVGPMPHLGPQESGRRELADWIASPNNPLTARVMVNRIWHHLFGVGIVRTVDNFGSTGELPSHPELLDFLATRFIEEGWSVKKLIREIVLSRTFQMSSAANADGLQSDPENRLLWRMNRRRLEAECIRDTILVVSGALDRTCYGNTIRKGTTVERDYVFDDVRRSVYTPIFRNRLLELFEVFDFPDPNMVVGRRNVSTVPTQALYLMNSPFVMNQARQAAELALQQKRLQETERIDRAYRTALGRLPTARERQLVLTYLGGAATPEQRLAAWERVYQALFACVDFRYLD